MKLILALVLVLGSIGPLSFARSGGLKAIEAPWGQVRQVMPPGQGLWELVMHRLPPDHRLPLPVPFDHITSARVPGGGFAAFDFNADATRIAVEVPGNKAPKVDPPTRLFLETAEKTIQRPDGRIIFSALDAVVEGNAARLETHPGNHRIGFWTRAEDSVHWDHGASRWGMYDVELTYSSASPDGSEIVVSMGGQEARGKLASTGSWYRYTTLSLGRLYLAKAGQHRMAVRCAKKVGPAVMNLKAVTLRPAPEGKPVTQSEDGSISMHARDVTVHGVRLRYEPAEKKQCVGFWSDAEDWMSWDFAVTRPGRFRVRVAQGCGKGHGGSFAEVTVGGLRERFVVEDTGHFQNFKWREIGEVELSEPGRHTLAIRAVSKARGAVMDVREVRLAPLR